VKHTPLEMVAGIKKAGMTKKWIAINLLLLAIAALLGWQLRASIQQFKAENDLAKVQPTRDIKTKLASEPPLSKVAPAKSYTPAEFALIAEKNIFSETRSRDDKVEAAVPPEPPPLVQRPVLVGVVITEKQRTASIIDPLAPQLPNARTRGGQIKRIGDVYQGYTITEISPERIVLESGTRREVIPLREGTKRTGTGKTPILSTRVAPIGGGGTSGGTPTGGAGGSAPAAPARNPVTPGGTPAGAAAQAPARATPPAASSAPPAQTAPQTAPSNIIRTPFGDITRPAR